MHRFCNDDICKNTCNLKAGNNVFFFIKINIHSNILIPFGFW